MVMATCSFSATSFSTISFTVCGAAPVVTGAEAGGRVRKAVGRRLVSDDLGNRPVLQFTAQSQAQTVLNTENKSNGRLRLPIKINSVAKILQHFESGQSISKTLHKQNAETVGRIRFFEHSESKGQTALQYIFDTAQSKMEKFTSDKVEKIKKLLKIQNLFYQIESIDKMYEDVKPVILSFEFNEPAMVWLGEASQAKLRRIWGELSIKQRVLVLKAIDVATTDRQTIASLPFSELPDSVKETLSTLKDSELGGFFKTILPLATTALILNIIASSPDTSMDVIKKKPLDMDKVKDVKPTTTVNPNVGFNQPSSFIGLVRYNTDTLGLSIRLNGKLYNFCRVPRRVYDAFEGSSSKGAYFARNIRTLYDC